MISLELIIPAALIIGGAVLLFGFRLYLVHSYQNQQVDERVDSLQYFATRLTGQLGTHDESANGIPEGTEQELELVADMYDSRILIVGPDYRIVKDTFVIDEGRYVISPEVMNAFAGTSYRRLNRDRHYLEMALPVMDTISREVTGVLFISASTMEIYKSVRELNLRVSAIVALVFLFIVLLAVLAGILIRQTFARTQQSLARIGEGSLDAPLFHSRIYEISAMTEEYEHILKRLQFQSQTREEFVSNVSHELKTPIASMKVLADSLLLQEEVPAELYRDFMTDISGELDRETQIINDLLTLSRLDHVSSDDLSLQKVDIGALIEGILKRLRPLAQQRNIELVYESMREVNAEADPIRLSLALTNLVENAIKYNHENGWVKVVCDADYRYAYIRVADSGIGIPQEALPHVFERFYRVDKARSRERGGTGLGLSIASSIVLMHGGAIRVSSTPGEGSTFTVRIPVRQM